MITLGFDLKGFQFGARLLLFTEEYENNSARLSFKKLRVPQVLEQYYQEKYLSEYELSKVIFYLFLN
jgi:hypothetical protein